MEVEWQVGPDGESLNQSSKVHAKYLIQADESEWDRVARIIRMMRTMEMRTTETTPSEYGPLLPS